MFWIISFVLLLISCSPDTDSITAMPEEIMEWLPAKPDKPGKCSECALEKCSNERIECQLDEECLELLKCKGSQGCDNPNCFFNCNGFSDHAFSTYYRYHDCVFTNCPQEKECNAGKNWECDKDYDWNTGDEDDKEKIVMEEQVVRLTIRINHIRDLLWNMISPGQHSVVVKWVSLQSNSEDLVASSKRCKGIGIQGTTDGFGETKICVPKPNNTGYLLIQRGDPTKPNYEDLGPFIYYLGRPINYDQTITIHLPSKKTEKDWGIVPDNTKGNVILLQYDCTFTPARDFDFRLIYTRRDTNERNTLSNALYWIPSRTAYIELSSNTTTTTSLGLASFINVDLANPASSDLEAGIEGRYNDITYSLRSDIIIKANYTTYLVLYPITESD